MKKIQFEINESIFALAQRYTLDPLAHCAAMFDHWAQLAQQAHPGVNLMTLPTLAEIAEKQEAQQAAEALEAEQRKQAIARIIAKAPEAQQAALAQQLALPSATLDDAHAALAAAIDAEQERIAQEALRQEQKAVQSERQEQELRAKMVQLLSKDAAMLKEAAAAQGKAIVDAE